MIRAWGVFRLGRSHAMLVVVVGKVVLAIPVKISFSI
jgi:hypothetical protein